MGKLESITAIILAGKEVFEGVADFFKVSISGDFYKSLDKITFLTNETLGLSSSGSIIDATKSIGEAVCSLSNIVIWAFLLVYGFCSLFQYFLSKKVTVPWKMFIRSIVFLAFVNAAFFICYTLVFFTENITEYIVSYSGDDISFAFFDNDNMKIDKEIEEIDVLDMDDLMKLSSYFFLFAFSIILGMRFLLIKTIIIFSPIILCFGCFELTEKVFFKVGVLFLKLLFYQVFITVVLEILSNVNFSEDGILNILFLATMLLGIRLNKKMF